MKDGIFGKKKKKEEKEKEDRRKKKRHAVYLLQGVLDGVGLLTHLTDVVFVFAVLVLHVRVQRALRLAASIALLALMQPTANAAATTVVITGVIL